MTPPTDLPRIVEAIVHDYQPERIILFGSYARGDAKAPHSDLDLLVLKDGAASNRLESAKIRRCIRQWIGPYSFTILPMDPRRLDERSRNGEAFIQTVLLEGRELYAKNGREKSAGLV
ncbi:MAG: nucleotidyltransferase domain-containing protein [Verrucomicrobia bacterium]|nr:nucleotidyltransferase domain-containing protein [Verrucomicrobiota bacterium]